MIKPIIRGMHCMLGILLTAAALPAFVSCSENIDESAYAIKEEPTMNDYITENPNTQLIKRVFDRVRLGGPTSSTLSSVLSARGNYTVFAPTDSAMRAFCLATCGSADPDSLSYSDAQLIAFSCIIDNGSGTAYESVDFPLSGSFVLANLNDRLLSCLQDSDSNYIINGSSLISSADHLVSNGVLHMVNKVIAPAPERVPEMIAAAGNMKIMAKLLRLTGLHDSLLVEKDNAYEDNPNLPETRYWSSVAYLGTNHNWAIPRKRYLGFTGFIETDDVFARDWKISEPEFDETTGQIKNWDKIYAQLLPKIQAAYPDATDADPTSLDNAVNRFVAYHFVKGKMAYNRFVHHCTEHNYRFGSNILQPQDVNYTVDVWDYYTTIDMGSDGRRGLIKVLQIPDGEHEIYLNRISTYDNGLQGTYKEKSTRDYVAGVGINILIKETNGEFNNNASNGYYYPIDGILLYDNEARNALAGERIRIDLTTMVPELISNNFRGLTYEAFQHGYFENILHETEGTEIYYLQCGWNGTGYWHDYQGDEFLFSGLYDFVLRLPPVPKDGTYELRMGSALNSLRGMCQIYFGESPDNTLPVGLPFDLRQSTNYVSGTGSTNPEIPFILDKDLDWDEDRIVENDKDLRIHGYMKAPAYFWDCTFNSQCRHQGSDALPCLRRIITVDNLKANKSYYLRFKSSLKKLDSQFFVDYFEFVPSQVYNGPEPEDVW